MRNNLPARVISRDGTVGTTTGSTHNCQMDGCTGIRITVKWPDGTWTHPCSKGMTAVNDNTWRIV